MWSLENKDKNYLLLHEKKIYQAFLYLAFPVILANLLKSVHEIVDTYFIGQMDGSVAAQAGMSITWPVLDIFMAVCVGLSVAGVAIISQQLGAKDTEAAREYMGLLVVLSVIVGAIFNVVAFLLSPWVLGIMGAEGAVYDAALTYLRVRSFEMIFLFLFTAFQATRQARGDTVTPVLFSVITILINIVLTALFINVMQLGVFGAAVATVIGQIVVAPLIVMMLFSKKDPLSITKKHLQIRPIKMKKLVMIAMPSAGSQALSSLGFLILQAVILSYGDAVAAAFSIGNKVSNLLLIPIFASGTILAAFVGQNIGAGNKERALLSYRVSRNTALVISIVGCILLFPIREDMLMLLTNDGRTLEVAMDYIFWVILTQPLMALFQNYLGVFNGSGNTKYSFVIASARLWVFRLPIIVLFKEFTNLGEGGIWLAMVMSNILVLLIAKVLFQKVDFKIKV